MAFRGLLNPISITRCTVPYVVMKRSRLRGWVSVLEMVFVGQCEVFVLILRRAFFPPLAAKLIGPQTGCQFFKNSIFLTPTPLKFGEKYFILNLPFHLFSWFEEIFQSFG